MCSFFTLCLPFCFLFIYPLRTALVKFCLFGWEFSILHTRSCLHLGLMTPMTLCAALKVVNRNSILLLQVETTTHSINRPIKINYSTVTALKIKILIFKSLSEDFSNTALDCRQSRVSPRWTSAAWKEFSSNHPFDSRSLNCYIAQFLSQILSQSCTLYTLIVTHLYNWGIITIVIIIKKIFYWDECKRFLCLPSR